MKNFSFSVYVLPCVRSPLLMVKFSVGTVLPDKREFSRSRKLVNKCKWLFLIDMQLKKKKELNQL